MFKKLDIYIIKKFLGTFVYSIALIISITIVFDIAEKIDDFIEKGAPLKVIIFDYYINFIPYFANLFSMLFVFISVIFFTSKMASDTEIIAILSSGISFKRMLVPYFTSALIIAVASFVLNSFIIPPANKTRLEFESTYIFGKFRNRDRDIHRQIRPGIFIYLESYNTTLDMGYKFSIESFEDNVLKSKLMADFIKWSEEKQTWEVNNYMIRTIHEHEEIIERGTVIDSSLVLTAKDFSRRNTFVETMNYFELNEFIDQKRLEGDENINSYLIEKHKRFAGPFASFILMIIGVTLASRKTRGGIGLHIGIGLLLSFTYIVFQQFATVFSVYGNVAPAMAVWIPNIVYAGIAFLLYRIAPK